jgi:hypothetical protein
LLSQKKDGLNRRRLSANGLGLANWYSLLLLRLSTSVDIPDNCRTQKEAAGAVMATTPTPARV